MLIRGTLLPRKSKNSKATRYTGNAKDDSSAHTKGRAIRSPF